MTVWNKWIYRKWLLQRATGIGAVALLLAAYFTFACSSVLVYAASGTGGTGRIYGQLLNGSHKNAPVGGERVTLQMAQGNNATDLSSAITDAHGSYSFA